MPCQQFPKGQPPANSKGGPFDTEAECKQKIGQEGGCPCCNTGECSSEKRCCLGQCVTPDPHCSGDCQVRRFIPSDGAGGNDEFCCEAVCCFPQCIPFGEVCGGPNATCYETVSECKSQNGCT
jgi:hypothetical protein